ncbi:MAG: M20/M25/M40 family metallo-hydrolase, partial [Clostridioides difficile]|nr:M20/M25/M40 family metallo-hydrolase [Clostridioides difficile]
MLNETRKKQLTEVCQDLIRNASYSGQEENVVKAIEENFALLGFDSWSRDRYGNIVGCIKGNKPGKKILFDGHIDTVPVPDASKWSVPPFEARIVDGKIYGRGTSDMKGQVSAMMAAVSYFAEDTNKDFEGELYVAGVVHEEIFEGVSAREISKAVQPDYVVIGESSELNLKIGQRGRGEIVVETFGKPAHSANPEKGINAVYKMANVIQKIQQLVPPTHPVLGEIQALLDEMMKEDPELNAKVSYAVEKADCYTGNTIESERFFPGWLYDEEDEFVQAAYKGLKEAGIDSEITQYSFCTNGSH